MTFEQQHRDITLRYNYDEIKTYWSLDEKGRILEAWSRDEEGVWHDVTLREQEKQKAEWELAKAQRELKKLQGGQN